MVTEKYDISNVILISFLGGKEYSYNKLWNDVHKRTGCSIATFEKHLKKLVEKKWVERMPQKNSQNVIYKMNQDQIDKISKLDPIIKKFEENVEEQFQNFESFVKAYEQAPKEEVNNFKKDSSRYDSLTSGIMDLYHYLTIFSFFSTSGMLSKLTIKRVKGSSRYYLQKLETDMNQLKKVDPELHKRLCLLILKGLKFNR